MPPEADTSIAAITQAGTEPVFEALHPKALWGMRVSAVLGWAWAYALPAGFVLGVANGRWGWFALGFVPVLVLAWRYAGARFRHTHYALTEDALLIRRGVFWCSETLVPRSRVQHTDLNRGPIDRHFGLATLRVYTAGSRLASVSLDGLPEARAEALRDALIERNGASGDDAL